MLDFTKKGGIETSEVVSTLPAGVCFGQPYFFLFVCLFVCV